MRPRVFYGWVVVATLCAVNVAIQATGTLNFGLFVLPMGTELGMSRSLIGWAQTARSLAGGVSSFNLGRLLDQHGARFLVAAAALVTGLGLVGLGFIHEVWQLFLLFALVGLVGLSAPGGLLTSVPVAKWFVRQRGRAMSVATVGFGVGAVAFLPITQLLIAGLGWRGAWVVLGIVSTAIIVPLSLLFLRRQPEDMGLAPDGEATPRTVGAHSPRQEEPAWTAGEALRTATLWKLTLAFMLVGFGMGGAGVHRIPYWVERGFNPQLVSYSFAADAAAAGVMALLSGILVERFPVRFVTSASSLVFAAAVGLMLLGSNGIFMFGSTILFGLAVGTNMVVQTYIWADYYGRAFLGTIRGIVLPATLVSSGAGSPIAGYIYDRTGTYIPAWWLLVAIFLLAATLTLSALPPGTPPRKARASG